MPELKQQLHADDTGDLRALEQLAKERSSDRRRELMSRLADIMTEDGDTHSDETAMLLGQNLVVLLDQVDEPARAELSNRVAANETTPHGLVKKLAQDTSVRVTEPVLTQSPVLSDDDLVEIASEGSEGRLLAISRRPNISTQVTDAVIEHGTTAVFQVVAENSGAVISENGFRRLSEEAPSSDALAKALSQRNDIPEAVAEEVIASLPTTYRMRLEVLWASDRSGGQDLLEEASQQVGERRLSKRSGILQAKVAVRGITSGIRSLDNVIDEFAGSNLPSETAHVLAAIAKLPEKYVKAALLRRDGTAITVICRSVNLGDRAFEEITRMRGSQLGLEASDGHKLLQAFRTLDADTARRTVRFAGARSAIESSDKDRRSGQDKRTQDEKTERRRTAFAE